MTNRCNNLTDPVVRKLCNAVGPENSDVGVAHIDYRRNGAPPIVRGAGDGKIEDAEVYRAALSPVASAADAQRRNALFRQLTRSSIPWMPNPANRALIERAVDRITGQLAQTGIDKHNAKYRERLALALFDWVRRDLKIRFATHAQQEGTIDDIIRRRYARCSEYMTLLYGVMLLAGLPSYAVEVHQDTTQHAAIAVIAGTAAAPRYIVLDGQLGHLSGMLYRHYFFGEASNLHALYLRNLSSNPRTDTITPSRIHHLNLAARIAPHNWIIHNALGDYHKERSDWVRAAHHYGAAMMARPSDPRAKRHYCLAQLFLGNDTCPDPSPQP